MFFDPLYLLILSPALLLMLYAQFKVQSSFSHYSQKGIASGMSGAEVAQAILDANGIQDVHVEEVDGFLSDHYDPSEKILRLSPGVYHGRSTASVGVAAHEVGHAIQHTQNYVFLGLRSALVPVVQIGSFIWFPLFFLGMIFHVFNLALLGIVVFASMALFQIITLPVEFDASSRALREIDRLRIVTPSEKEDAAAVLDAAALTYVAAALQSILTVVYLFLRLNSHSREN